MLSTISFTLMFAVWLMFGVLSVPIQKEFGLTDAQVAWILAVAILNGSIWRLLLGCWPTGSAARSSRSRCSP